MPNILSSEADNEIKVNNNNIQRKSLPVIKNAINAITRHLRSSINELEENLSSRSTPIILQKADIAIVNELIINNYIANSNNINSHGFLNINNNLMGNLKEKFFTSSLIKTISLEEKNKFNTIQDEENEDLYENFINALLRPSEWSFNLISLDKNGIPKFRFRKEHIIALTKACNEIISSQPMVLKIKTPVKVFGDIHGQYEDLMRFFELWGEPSESPGVGDINLIDYLFLGDYIDRGVNSLETICLLMALKIKYPDKIHLLRGNHEDRLINSNFGFLEECEFRLVETREPDELSVFNVINEFFDCLPLAAIINEEILCIHGGLGGCLTKVSEIEEIKRPLKVVHEATNKTEQIVMDILWSDPTDNDQEYGIQPNVMRDSRNYGNIVKFGPDIVEKFLKNNNLSMIIRAHECVLDGFERFDGGNLITVFSATDYCKRHKNAGAMLIINNNFEIIPHLIYPILETNSNSPDQNINEKENIGANNLYSQHKRWIDEDDDFKARPPTPLRSRNQGGNNTSNRNSSNLNNNGNQVSANSINNDNNKHNNKITNVSFN